MGDVVWFLFLLIFEIFGPIILVILGVWGLLVWRKAAREMRSRDSSWGDPALMKLENLHLNAQLLRTAGVILGLGAFVVSLILGTGLEWALIIAAVGGGLMLFWSAIVKRRYNACFKENVVTAELSKVFAKLHYRPNDHFSADEISGLDLFDCHDVIGGNDYIEADYRGVHFAQCDLGVREKYTVRVEDSNGHTKEETVYRDIFNGRAMRFEFAEEFKGVVRVVQRNFSNARLESSRGGWVQVETELAEFNDHFEVFATSEIEALQTLSPLMIEGIFYLERIIDYPIALHFKGHRMYAFLTMRREAFEVSGNKTLLEERELLKKDIALVTGFLETMYFKRQLASDSGDQEQADAPPEVAAPAAAAQQARPAPIPEPERRQLLPPRLSYKLGRAGRVLADNPSLALVAVFLASAVYTLIKFPFSFALSVSVAGDAVALDQYVPTVAYLLVLGLFIGVGALSGGRRKIFSLIWTGLLLLFHFFFLNYNLG